MAIYFILMLFLALISFIGYRINNIKITCIISWFCLFTVMAIRKYTVGTDIVQYLYRYNNVIYSINKEIIKYEEWGFYSFSSIVRYLGFSDQLYIATISLFISIVVAQFIYKYSKNVFFSFFLYITIGLFTMSLSGVRQMMAICITLIAFQYGLNKRVIGFILMTFFASTFHTSALYFLPIYLFLQVKFPKSIGKWILLLTYSSLLYRIPIGKFLNIFAPEKYLNKYGVFNDSFSVNPLIIIVALAIPTACYFVINKVTWEDYKNYSIFFLLSCLNAIITILSLNSIMIGRFSYYFAMYNIILIPYAITSIKDVKFRQLAYLACLFLPLIQFIISTPGGTLQIDNYKFFWQ